MNKKGFTLVELIATILIMLLITTLAVPAVISLLSKSDDKLDNAIKKQLVSYAKTYMKDNDYVNNISAFEEGKTYCILVDNLTEENFVDQDNNETKGRIEIKKDGNKFAYTYSSSNTLDGCENFPILSTNNDDSELILTPNNDPEFDPDTVLGILIEKYDYTEEVPNFKEKSPKDASTATYRQKVEKYIYKYTSDGQYTANIIPYTLYPVICNSHVFEDRNEGFDNLNVKSYFGKSYTFDSTTGKYTLENTINGYMNTDDPINNQYIYTCANHEKTCETMYEITSYSCHSQFYNPVGKCTTVCKGLDGNKYTKRKAADTSDSGLYKTYDNSGPVYYFRGAVENNYIKFDNSDILFQITRFNSDNSIRLISKEPIYEDGTTTAKKISYNGMYVNYANTYKLSCNGNETSNSTNDLTDYNSYTIYNSANLDNKFKTTYTFSDQNTSYPTLDKCFTEGTSPCVGKYIKSGTSKLGKITKITTGTNYLGNPIYKFSYEKCSANNVGLEYYEEDDSTLKKELEKWYNEKMIENDNFIVNGKFCTGYDPYKKISYQDTIFETFEEVYRLDNSLYMLSPTFTCSSPVTTITSKVGTLTADEVVFAGATTVNYKEYNFCFEIDDDDNKKNTDFFLYRPNGFLTMSRGLGDNYDEVAYICDEYGTFDVGPFPFKFLTNNVDTGVLGYSNIDLPVYPVINIHGDVKVTGTGTKTNPFVIDTSIEN